MAYNEPPGNLPDTRPYLRKGDDITMAERKRMRSLSLAVGAALLVVSVLAACRGRSGLPEGAELIPADATFAVSLDVPAIMESRLYEKYKSDENLFGRNRLNFYRFAEATGLNPAEDVKRVLFLARAGEQGLEDMSALVMGTFDGRKVHQFLVDSGLPSRKASGVDIFEFIVIEGRCRFCLAVFDASTAAFGDGETLETMARVKNGETSGLADGESAARLLRRLGRDPEAWGIVRAQDMKSAMAELLKNASADAGALAALGPIQEISFSFDTAEPMRVLIEMTANSDKDALMVADVLKGAESLGRIALREANPDLAMLMSDVVIEADTGLVRVAGSIPASDVDAAARLLGADWLTGRISPVPPAAAAPSP